jgi:hypothetical protein
MLDSFPSQQKIDDDDDFDSAKNQKIGHGSQFDGDFAYQLTG